MTDVLSTPIIHLSYHLIHSPPQSGKKYLDVSMPVPSLLPRSLPHAPAADVLPLIRLHVCGGRNELTSRSSFYPQPRRRRAAT
jgi:hypothetical protein